jgi:hypothetical protein
MDKWPDRIITRLETWTSAAAKLLNGHVLTGPLSIYRLNIAAY